MNVSQLLTTSALALGALSASVGLADAAYVQVNLVSDISGLASVTDPSLANPWGVSFRGGSPFWVSDQGASVTTLYSVKGPTSVSKIGINPPTGFVTLPQGPTGQVSNSSASSFDVGNGGNGKPADFIFAGLNGQISAWNGGKSSFVQWTSGVAYTGLAINQAQTMLYAASASGIDVYNNAFAPTSLGMGAFQTPTAISSLGLVPFNVEDIGGNVYVTYAPSGHSAQTSAVAGRGAIAVFTEAGALEPSKTMVGGALASPWGVAWAPSTFGPFGGDLLVGNFSFADSKIDAFNPVTDALAGSIPIDAGLGDMPGGLWSLTFGTGGGNGSPNVLYFTDGINHETGGLFGAIVSTPEPSTWAMLLVGFGGLGFAALRQRKQSFAAA